MHETAKITRSRIKRIVRPTLGVTVALDLVFGWLSAASGAPPPSSAATAAGADASATASGAALPSSESQRPVEVVVNGDTAIASPGPRDPSVASSVIRRDRLVGPGLQTQDVLRALPGVSVSENGGYGSPATAAIRGATAADTPVYLGGVRLNDDVGGTADLSLVPLWLLDHIEVYRGHPPIDADRLTPGGAIFFEPKRPNKSTGAVGYYAGSLGVSKGWAYAGTKSGRVSGLFGVSADRASNRYSFVNDRGTLFNLRDAFTDYRGNADERTLEGWGLSRVELGRGATLDVLANGITREQGVPRLAVLQTKRARAEYSRALASATLRVPLDERRRAALLTRSSLLRGSSEYNDPLNNELNLRTPHLVIVGTRFEQTLGARIEATDSLLLQPTINFAYEQIEREPNNIPLGGAHREFGRAALGAKQRLLDWLSFTGIVSAECHHTGITSDKVCGQLEPTGRVGFELGEGSVRLLGNWGRYVRVPTLGELYGISGTLHGNPALGAERSQSAELGVRACFGRGTLFHGGYVEAFVFSRWVDGLITYERAGEGFMVPNNVDRARLLGAEILTGIRLTSIVRTDVSATLLDPRNTTPGRTTVNDVLPFRSRLVLVPRVRTDWKSSSARRSTLNAAGGELHAVYQSSYYADPGGLGVIPEQTSVGLEGYLTWFGGILTTRGRISDLFNAKRTDMIGYPLPGRSGYFGLEATW